MTARSIITRSSLAGGLGLCCLLVSGCALERSSLSIDSASRMPWLGLQFMPKKKKVTESYHRSIAEQRNETAGEGTVEPAVRTKTELRLPNWFGPKSEPTGTPLPRTDLSADGTPAASETTDEALPFVEF